MSENSLVIAINNLKTKYNLSPYQQKKINQFFSTQNVGDYIYAGHLKSFIAVDIKVAYKILEELRSQKYLEILYEIYCTKCSKSKGIFINSLTDFKEDTYCEFCDKPLNPIDNTIVLYKVIAT